MCVRERTSKSESWKCEYECESERCMAVTQKWKKRDLEWDKAETIKGAVIYGAKLYLHIVHIPISPGVECFVDCLHSTLVIYAPEYTFYPMLRQLEPTDSTSIVIAIRFGWMYYSLLVKVHTFTTFDAFHIASLHKQAHLHFALIFSHSCSCSRSFDASTFVY